MAAGRGPKSEPGKAFVGSSISERFAFADVKRAAPGVSDEYIRQVLRQLRDAGVVEVIGAGKRSRVASLGVLTCLVASHHGVKFQHLQNAPPERCGK